MQLPVLDHDNTLAAVFNIITVFIAVVMTTALLGYDNHQKSIVHLSRKLEKQAPHSYLEIKYATFYRNRARQSWET